MDIEHCSDNFHSHFPWRKAFLIPIWAFETTILAINVVIMGLLIGVTKVGSENNTGGIQPWTIINLLTAALSLVVTLVQVTIFINRDLSPRIYLWAVALKSIIALVPIAFEIHVTRTKWIDGHSNKTYLGVGFGFGSVVYLANIFEAVYGLYVLRRVGKYRRLPVRFSSPEVLGELTVAPF